jgi:CheY-like chemotaxis protein
MNLCTNARDAMPDGGVLSIRAESSGDRAEVEIEDTGEGMSPETQKKCFDPFFTTKEKHQGTGLGLSTSYGIIKNHGGEVSLYSVPGRGTRFRVHLPLVVIQEEVGDTEEEIEIPFHGKGRKILVVDDEESMLSALRDLLESLGYAVVTAPGASEALKVYQSQAPELVLMDRNMPGMDGIAGMKELLRMDPQARVILISGYDEQGPHGIDETTREMLAGYITKPVDVMELSLSLGRLFEDDESE